MKKLFYVFFKYVENRDKDTIAYKEGIERTIKNLSYAGSKGIIACAENEDEILKALPDFLNHRFPSTGMRMESIEITIGEPCSDIIGKSEFLVSNGYVTPDSFYGLNLQKALDSFYKEKK